MFSKNGLTPCLLVSQNPLKSSLDVMMCKLSWRTVSCLFYPIPVRSIRWRSAVLEHQQVLTLGGKCGRCTQPPVQPAATFNLWYVIVTHSVLGALIIISGTRSRDCVHSAVVETNQKTVLSLTSAKGNRFSA